MIQQGAIAPRKPNDPPGKPVGFERLRQAAGVAASLTIHRASRWDSLRNATLHRKAAHPKCHRPGTLGVQWMLTLDATNQGRMSP